jgi:hypothetical protein
VDIAAQPDSLGSQQSEYRPAATRSTSLGGCRAFSPGNLMVSCRRSERDSRLHYGQPIAKGSGRVISKIYITGDAGEDLFAYPQGDSHRERPAEKSRREEALIDLRAPSGAWFIKHVLSELFRPEKKDAENKDVGKMSETTIPLCLLSGPCEPKLGEGREIAPLLRVLTRLKEPEQKKDAGRQRVLFDQYSVLEKREEKKGKNWLTFPINESFEADKGSGAAPAVEAANASEPSKAFDADKLLVVHDSCNPGGWSTHEYPCLLKKQKELIEAFRIDKILIDRFQINGINRLKPRENPRIKSGEMRILVNLKDLPEVDEDHEDKSGKPAYDRPGYPEFRSQLWQTLAAAETRESVGIVVSLDTLRRAGIVIRHGLSWEQTVEDFAAELHLFRRLSALSQFRHLFVRIDGGGLIHLRNDYPEAGCRLCGTLYFKPFAQDANPEGHIVGKNTMLIACLIDQLNERKKPEQREDVIRAIDSGIKLGIVAVQLAHKDGYDIRPLLKDPPKNGASGGWPNAERLIDTLLSGEDKDNDKGRLLYRAKEKLRKQENGGEQNQD